MKDLGSDLNEDWCFNFAYSFLISNEEETKESFSKANKALLTSETRLKELSLKYCISKLALMIRFRNLHIISDDEYYNTKRSHPYKIKISEVSSGNYYNTVRSRLSRGYRACQ
jgi:Zn-dependent peptidase ImmA (M78 family)